MMHVDLLLLVFLTIIGGGVVVLSREFLRKGKNDRQ